MGLRPLRARLAHWAPHWQWTPALWLGGTLALVLAVSAWVLALQLQALQGAQRQPLGALIVQQLAHAVEQPLVNRDLVSLQVLLEDLHQHPAVIYASVQDVDQQLLAAAGKPQPQQPVFTQGVTVQDSLAGTVAVTLNGDLAVSQRQRLWWQLTLVALLGLAAVIAGGCWLSRHWQGQLQAAIERLRHITGDEPTPEIDLWRQLEQLSGQLENQLALDNLAPAEQEQQDDSPALLLVRLPNLSKWQRHLNAADWQHLLARFDALASKVMALYAGDEHRWPSADPQLQGFPFAADPNHPAAFRALCAAALIRDLVAAGAVDLPNLTGVRWQLSCAVLTLPASDSPGHLSQSEQLRSAQQMLSAADSGQLLVADGSLAPWRERFRAEAATDHWQQVAGFHEPYASLLAGQRHQLEALLRGD